MNDAQTRRQQLLQAAVELLREEGYSGFTQPRVAARAGLRQSHLTYYFPTRGDLLAAVARTAIDNQLARMAALPELKTTADIAKVVGETVSKHENTRVMMALVLASEEEPRVRELFRELADGISGSMGGLLSNLGCDPTDTHRRLLHALSVGLAVVDLAVARPGGERRSADVFGTALSLLSNSRRAEIPS